KGFLYVAIYLVFCYTAPEGVATSVAANLMLAVCTVSLAYTLPGIAEKILRGNDISYGVYIYHGLILNILVSLNMMHRPEYFFVVLFGAFVLGYLSWILVERRFLRKKALKLRSV